jgi:hypothetical protein
MKDPSAEGDSAGSRAIHGPIIFIESGRTVNCL